MKVPLLIKYNKINWQDINTPKINKGQVLVKVGYASICGSDEHAFRGDFHPRTKLPFVQGHEFAGTIVETGKAVQNFKTGDRVAVDPIFWCGKCVACKKNHHQACKSLKLLGIDVNGGFGEYVAADEFMLYKLTDNISDKDAAMVELFSIGFHACNRSGISNGDSAVIFGTGKIGHAIMQAVQNRTDSTIIVVDTMDERLAIAKEVNKNVHTINCLRDDPIKKISDITNGCGTDIAFEAVGHAKEIKGQNPPVRQAVQTIRQGGIITVLGLSDKPVPLVMKELIMKEAKLITSRVSAGEFDEAIKLLSEKKLNPSPLITDELPASEVQNGFEMLEKEPEKHLKILIKCGE